MGREVQRSAFDFDSSLSLLYPALFSCTKALAFLPPSLLTGSQELRLPSPEGLAAVTAGSQTRLSTMANKKAPRRVCDPPVVANAAFPGGSSLGRCGLTGHLPPSLLTGSQELRVPSPDGLAAVTAGAQTRLSTMANKKSSQAGL